MTNETVSTSSRSHRVADRLHSAAIRLLRLLRKHDAASGLTGARLSALSVVVYSGPIAVGELATAEQVRAPTMTRLVRALEEAGLVVREAATKDRRVTLVRATEQGVRLLEEGRDRRVLDLRSRLEGLAAEDVAVLDDAVSIIERVLNRP